MAGGTRIVAFYSGSQEASEEEILPTGGVEDVPWNPQETTETEGGARSGRGWLPMTLTALALAGWTGFFAWMTVAGERG